MKLKLSWKRKSIPLLFALAWAGLGFLFYHNGSTSNSIILVCVAISLLYLTFFGLGFIVPYLSISNGTIRKGFSLWERIKLDEITQIGRFGDTCYLLKTADSQLTVYTDFIEKKSRQKFTDFLTVLAHQTTTKSSSNTTEYNLCSKSYSL